MIQQQRKSKKTDIRNNNCTKFCISLLLPLYMSRQDINFMNYYCPMCGKHIEKYTEAKKMKFTILQNCAITAPHSLFKKKLNVMWVRFLVISGVVQYGLYVSVSPFVNTLAPITVRWSRKKLRGRGKKIIILAKTWCIQKIYFCSNLALNFHLIFACFYCYYFYATTTTRTNISLERKQNNAKVVRSRRHHHRRRRRNITM